MKKVALHFQDFLRKKRYFEQDPFRKSDGTCMSYEDLYDLFIIDYKKRNDNKK